MLVSGDDSHTRHRGSLSCGLQGLSIWFLGRSLWKFVMGLLLQVAVKCWRDAPFTLCDTTLFVSVQAALCR